MKRIFALVLILILVVMTGCSNIENIVDGTPKDWQLIEESGKGSTVNVLVDSDDEAFLTWLKEDFKSYVKLNSEITLNITEQSMEKTHERLKRDLENETDMGQYDVVFLMGDTFKSLKSDQLLYGPFVSKLPNVMSYLDMNDEEMKYDEGLAIEGAEVPFARSQLSMIYNEDVFYEAPESRAEMAQVAQDIKGQFTYPDPRKTKEGEAFVLSMVAPYLDYEKVNTETLDDKELLEMIQPGFDDLKALSIDTASLKSSWQALDDAYENLELAMSMTLDYNYAYTQTKAYEYPEMTGTFAIPEGSVGYTDYVGIAFNSPNKSGAMLVINDLLSPSIQGEIYDPKNWGRLTVYPIDEVDSSALTEIKGVKLRSPTLDYDELLPSRYPEVSPALRQQIISLWEKHVMTSELGSGSKDTAPPATSDNN